MSFENEIRLIGNLTRQPELNTLPSGRTVCLFCTAVNRRYIVNGEQKTETTYVECKAWGKVGERICKNCQKGTPIILQGSLTGEEWQDRETGKKRSRLVVTVDRSEVLLRQKSETQADGHRYNEEDTNIDM